MGLALNYSSSALAADSQSQYRSWEDVARKNGLGIKSVDPHMAPTALVSVLSMFM